MLYIDTARIMKLNTYLLSTISSMSYKNVSTSYMVQFITKYRKDHRKVQKIRWPPNFISILTFYKINTDKSLLIGITTDSTGVQYYIYIYTIYNKQFV